MRCSSYLSALAFVLICACVPSFAQGTASPNMAIGFSVGYVHPVSSTQVNVQPGGFFDNTYSTLSVNDGGELGLDLSVIHGERFSTRWGMTYAYQGTAVTNFGGSSLNRATLGGYVQGNFNIINGVGKAWFLTVGGVYNNYSISQNGSSDSGGSSSNEIDKTSKAGFTFGTGITFNGKTFRWTPEVLVQKVGNETTGIFRLHCQVPFSSR